MRTHNELSSNYWDTEPIVQTQNRDINFDAFYTQNKPHFYFLHSIYIITCDMCALIDLYLFCIIANILFDPLTFVD